MKCRLYSALKSAGQTKHPTQASWKGVPGGNSMRMHVVESPLETTTTLVGGGVSEVFPHAWLVDSVVHLQPMSLLPKVVKVIISVDTE